MKAFITLMTLAIASHALAAEIPAPSVADELSKFDTIFLTPSADESGSIPLGNGNTGINLWVEEDGDLIFYVARNDAWAEAMTLCKLGKVRVRLAPNPFRKGYPYYQHLKLIDGCCEITAGQDGQKVHLKVFVDSDSGSIYVTGACDMPTQITAAICNWRLGSRRDMNEFVNSNMGWVCKNAPAEIALSESPDYIDASEGTAITTWHRNETSVVPLHIEQQKMQRFADRITPLDPIKNNTFGMRLAIDVHGGVNVLAPPNTLRSTEAVRRFEVRVDTHARQAPTLEIWRTELQQIAKSAPSAEAAAARTAAWWREFWNRSWIVVSGDNQSIPDNSLPLRLGADGAGGSPFAGEIARATIIERPLSDAEIGTLVQQPRDRAVTSLGPVTASHPGNNLVIGGKTAPFAGGWYEVVDSSRLNFPEGVTVEAWIKPASLGGRIWDKNQPGSAQGLTFDLLGDRVRLICGRSQNLMSTETIKAGEWSHVAAVIDPSSDRQALFINGKLAGQVVGNSEDATPSGITRAYILCKYQLACQMRSPYPAHFQGGIFTMDPKLAYYAFDLRDTAATPDYRFYGTNYWWQNLRFLYQPQLAQGNPEFHRALMDYMVKLAPVMEARSERHYGAKGIYFEECFSPFGLPSMFDFGWGEDEYSEPYARWTWQHCLEATVMMLDDYAYTQDAAFLTDKAIPYGTKCLQFFDTRFRRDDAGRIRIFPTHALETYWTEVVNDTPCVAGLHYVTERLLALPQTLTKVDDRAYWRKIQEQLPPISKITVNGKTVPDNAESYQSQNDNRGQKVRANYEAPDLYTVFPFRIYGLELHTHNIQEARDAWIIMPNPGHCCWYQTGVFAARLGLVDGAKEDVILRSRNRMQRTDKDHARPFFRFPGFFGSPHDWCPDYDGPGNMMVVLQEMLLQNGEHGEILLLQAWPKEWNVRFKLHAAQRTVVEGTVRNGVLSDLTVTPAQRKKDVIFPR